MVEQSEVTYDASGNTIQTTSCARKHTENGNGDLTSSSARVTYTASWFDGANRDRLRPLRYQQRQRVLAALHSPARSDTVLVSSTEFNTAGQAYKSIDPAGKESRSEFDDAGRTTKQIGNYIDGNPASGTSNEDVTVEMATRPTARSRRSWPRIEDGRPGHEVRVWHERGWHHARGLPQ